MSDDSFHEDMAREWEERDRQRDEDERAITEHLQDREER